MTPKEKELVAVAISVAAGCRPCTDHHVKVARKARATDEEIRQAIGDAIDVRHRAADLMEAYAVVHLDEQKEVMCAAPMTAPSRIKLLAGVGAAFAVDCVSSLKQELAATELAGISQDDIADIVKLAIFIKKKAASHVERLVKMPDEKAA